MFLLPNLLNIVDSYLIVSLVTKEQAYRPLESIGLHNLFRPNIVRHVSSLILLRWLHAVMIQPIKQGRYKRSTALVILCMRKVLATSLSWYLKACLLQVNLTKKA